MIICLAPATSSLFPPDFKYLKAPIKKYMMTKAEAMEKTGITSWLVAWPKDLISPKPNLSPIFT